MLSGPGVTPRQRVRTEYGAGCGGGQVRRRSYRVQRGPGVPGRGAPDDAVLVDQLVSQLPQAAVGGRYVRQVAGVNVSGNGKWGQSHRGHINTTCRGAACVI